MIYTILILFALITLGVDLLIYKRHISDIWRLRVCYIVQALLLDVGVLAGMVIIFATTTTTNETAPVVATWLALILVANVSIKAIFALFSIIEFAVTRITKKPRPGILIVGLVAAGSVFLTFVYGSTIGRNSLRVEHIVIESADLPAAFDGFRIAQFSDAHIGNFGSHNTLIERMVTRINELSPDIIVQSGDLINMHSGELTENRMAQFSKLKAPVYAVLGNHDMGYYIRDLSITPRESLNDLIAKQQTMGWTLLRNESVRIHRGDDSIAIAGVGYPENGALGVRSLGLGNSDIRKAFKGVKDSDFSVLIAHTPSMFDSVPEYGRADLTVSGHVHAMQAKISVGSWKWSPSKWLFPMWSGLWKDRGHQLYVNDGLGYVLYPLRIGTRPEITLFELRRTK